MATQYKKPSLELTDIPNPSLSEDELIALLYNLTGFEYVFAVSSSMRWGADGEIKSSNKEKTYHFYQVMPDKSDDGFFNWYCVHRTEHHFYESKSDATLQFIYYWMKWKGLGKPKN